jgi:hypothetical protein
MPEATELTTCMLPCPYVATASFNKKWVDDHMAACKQELGNKPLVVQEYNMPAGPQRQRLHNHVSCQLCTGSTLQVALHTSNA